MATSQATAAFSCSLETLWHTVTDLAHTAWRSDLKRVEILDAAHFLEHTKSGYATSFTVTVCDPLRYWAFTMENGNMSGFWEGHFAETADGCRLVCIETINAKHWWMRPFVPGYLKRQQKRYLDDLRRTLSGTHSPGSRPNAGKAENTNRLPADGTPGRCGGPAFR